METEYPEGNRAAEAREIFPIKELGRIRDPDRGDEENSEAMRDHRRNKLNPAVWKMPDEMFGFSIPRKARSAYVKRSPESREAVSRYASNSTLLTSPSSSDISIRKKKKLISGSEHRVPKVSNSQSSIQEIEIEVAEVLFGLNRQFQVPVKENLDQPPCKEEADESRSFTHGNDALVASSPDSTPKRKKTRHSKTELHLRSSVDGPQTRIQVTNHIKISKPSKSENDVFSTISPGKNVESSPSKVKEQVVEQKEERKFLSKGTAFDELTLNPTKSDIDRISAADTDLIGRKINSLKPGTEGPFDERETQKDLKEPKEDKERSSAPKVDPTSEKTGMSFPWLMPGAAWTGGLPFGYMGQSPLLQPNGPVDGHNRKVGIKRCAIHFHIAQNIFMHQKISQVNPLWSMAAAKAYENPNLISPNGKAAKLNSPLDFTQVKHPLQVAPATNTPLPPAFFFPMSQPRASGKPTEAQYVLLQSNGYHPPPIGILNGSIYQHPQWPQLALSSLNPNQQQIPIQSMKPDTITPQAMAMAYAAASGAGGFNFPFQNFSELAAKKGQEKGQQREDGGRSYQNTLSKSGPTSAPHPGPVSLEATLTAARNSLASGRPNGPPILEKTQATTFQQHNRSYPSSQLLFTNAAAAAGFYFRQESGKVKSHTSTMDAVSPSSSVIPMTGRSTGVSGDSLKANGVKGFTLPCQMPNATAGGALSLSSTVSTVEKPVAISTDPLKVNGVKSLTLPNFQAAQLSGATFPYLGLPPVLSRAAEQKSTTAGNDSLHPCWQQPEKRSKKTRS